MSQGVDLQISRTLRDDSYIQFKGSLPDLTEFTICMKIFRYHARSFEPYVSYATKDSENELLVG